MLLIAAKAQHLMNKPADITCRDHCVSVAGMLNADSVVGIVKQGIRIIIEAQQKICFDFTDAVTGDASAIAMLLAWIRTAHQHRHNIVFIHLPDKLLAIAELGGVAEIIQQYAAGK